MTMTIRRLIALPLAAATLAVGLLLAPAVTPVAASGVQTCYDSGAFNQKTIISRTTISGIGTLDGARSHGEYTGVYGQAYVRTLQPCIGGYGNGLAMVLPANLERMAYYSGAWHVVGMVQIGYWQYSNGARYFAYTPRDDDSAGCVPRTVGCMYAIAGYTPRLGDNYRFSIYTVGNTWVLKIENLSRLESPWSTIIPATWASGQRAWYGYEAKTWSDELGVDNAPRTLQVVLTDMRRRHADGAVSRVDGLYSCEKHVYGNVSVYCAFPSVQTTRDTLNVYS